MVLQYDHVLLYKAEFMCQFIYRTPCAYQEKNKIGDDENGWTKGD